MKKLSKNFSINFLFESDYKPKKLFSFIKKFKNRQFGINYDTGNSASLDYDFKEENVILNTLKIFI